MRTDTPVRLYCFPYAGAGTLIFRSWKEYFPANIQVYPVELPGRGRRMREPLLTRMQSLVEDVARTLESQPDGPYALFGHSMGALICFELARLFRNRRSRLPVHLFVSGNRAPQIPRPGPINYNLPQEEFISRLEAMGGMPKEMLEDKNFISFITPILRADMEACQTYEYRAGAPLSCPITAFGGTADDAVSQTHLEAWREQTASRFESYMFSGDHFFIRSHEASVLKLIRQKIAGL